MPPAIALLTDFGPDSPYVGQMKGKILGIHAGATIVDLTHSITPHAIREGSFVLADCVAAFPPGTVFVAVVDPGVGTPRPILIATANDQFFVLPDNGLISEIQLRFKLDSVYRVHQDRFPESSSTFHGRDIMAPIATRLCLGTHPSDLGGQVDQESITPPAVPAATLTAERIVGQVMWIDRFGNMITNIHRIWPDVEPVAVRIEAEGRHLSGIHSTYASQPTGTLMALFGSNGRLELGVNQGNAAQLFHRPLDLAVTLTRSDREN